MEPIFFLTHEYAPFRGGAATYVEECARAARGLGYDVRVVTATGRRHSPDEESPPTGGNRGSEESSSIPVSRVRSSGRLTPAGIAGLARGFYRMRDELADAPLVVLSAGAHMALISLAAGGIFAPKRVLSFFHGSEILKLGERRPWRWLAPRYYRGRPHFAVASDYVRTLLRESRLSPGKEMIHQAPCACGPELLAAANLAQRSAVSGSSVKNGGDPFRILTVARIHPRKGQLDLATAVARLPEPLRRRVVLQLVGVGDLDYLEKVRAVCRAADVTVEHLGKVPTARLPALYGACDLFALTSRTLPDSVEGFGIVYLEAGAFGCPVLAYRTGGVPEAVRDGETGLLVPEGDVAALSQSLAVLMEDRPLRERLGAAGRSFARSFSWDQAARVLCDAALALPR